jgi:nitrogen PTS system EIIA component
MSSRSFDRDRANTGAVDATSGGVKLTVREAARLLAVAESELYHRVEEGEIPFITVDHHPLFNRAELLEWATVRRLPLSIELFAGEGAQTRLVDALGRGGVHHEVGGFDLTSTLRAVVDCLPITDADERDAIAAILTARQADAATAVGSGIAIPHVRGPIVFAGQPAAVSLCFLNHAIRLGDAQVTTVFAMMTPTISGHLQLLSRLSLALHDDGFVATLLRRAQPAAVIAEAARIDTTLEAQ